MRVNDDRHDFGGAWTELKLDALNAYSQFFTTALNQQKFQLWYIDAFAGTGSRTGKAVTGGLFAGQPIDEIEQRLDGSAKRALAVQPPFQHLIFIEERRSHVKALEALQASYPDRDVRVMKGDANERLPAILAAEPWIGTQGWCQRAIIFLDPYGISVNFSTLRLIAKTERADVWYLVNLKGVVQQLAHDHNRLDNAKRQALNNLFGQDNWEEAFYKFQEGPGDLFSGVASTTGQRNVRREDVAAFYRSRLESIFSYVSSPLGLAVGTQQDYFQFYCMSNNPSAKARALIKKGAEAIIRKHATASRRTSAP